MTTPLQALDVALKTGDNATEVLARLAEQGFIVVHEQSMIRYATEVLRHMHGMTQPEAVANTVIRSAVMGANLEGMMHDGT